MNAKLLQAFYDCPFYNIDELFDVNFPQRTRHLLLLTFVLKQRVLGNQIQSPGQSA